MFVIIFQHTGEPIMNLKMLNTLSGQKELFIPNKIGEVRIYVCGVTLYDDIHIGHLKSIVSFEVMRNYFLAKSQNVTLVRNITDVDDKIIMKAEQLGIDPLNLVNSYIDKFHAVLEQLQIPMPDIEPRVTQYLPEISDYIEDLIANGTAYVTEDGVYFDTQKNKQERYPLSKKIVQDLDDNSRLDDKEYNKKHKADFALWKLDNKYGYQSNIFTQQGRPGWHIECSVMHHHTLGEHFDIHGGGRDLIFPHHENEILQSVAHNGINPANYWLHNGMMTSDGKKLSKSLGNSIYVKDMLTQYSGEALKLFLNKGQYNQSQEFKADELQDAQTHWDNFVRGIPHYIFDSLDDNTYFEQSLNMLEDDFNTPQVINVLHEGFKQLRKSSSLNVAQDILKIFKLLAVVPSNATLETIYEKWINEAEKPSAEVINLVEKRQQAKLDENYVLADNYRNQIQSLGWKILDKNGDFELRRL